MRLRPLFLLPLLLLSIAPDRGFAFELPGLNGDANRYLGEIRRRNPAGVATPQQRQQTEQRALVAEKANNWADAVSAWEDRIAAGNVTAAQWQSLARAQLRRNPPDATRALQAAWQAFQQAAAGADEIPPLLLMIQALQRLDRPVQLIDAWEAVVERAPDNASYKASLAAARRDAGVLVRRVSADADADPARACISFTVPPARRRDWEPADWVRSEPPVSGLAVTRDGDDLCIAGLPYGRTTRLVLRAGLPGEDGLKLNRDTPVPVAMGNRTPRILFDSRRYVLPRGEAPRVAVTTVNLSSLKLQLLRVGERGLVSLRNSWRLGDGPDQYAADNLADTTGKVVWEGRADIPNFAQNETRRTALPLPDAVRNAGPGLFVLVARAGDGTRGDDGQIVAGLPIISTDLGLIAWRGSEGLAVQARGLGDARPRAGVRVSLLAQNNDILGEATTGADGLARFAAPLLRGTGPVAPVSVHAEAGEGAAADLAQLDLEQAAFDLSDRGATGQSSPGPVDAFLWFDRGIYRPGETVQVAGLLRDAAGAPLAADLPVRLRLKRPNGQVFAETVPERGHGGAIFWPVALSRTAPAGQWTVEALTDPKAPPIATASLRVDAFVPESLAVTTGPVPGPLVPGTPLEVPVNARYLYGAPGAGLSGSATLRLAIDPEPFAEWKGWQFGQVGENFAPDLQTIDLPEADAQGNAMLPLSLPRAPDTTHPLRADVSVEVNQPDGRPTRAAFSVPVRAAGTLIAVRPAFADGSVDENAEAAFDIAAVNPQGRAVAAPLRLRLVRERPSWRVVVRESLARYETVYRDEPVDAADLRPAPGKPAHFARRLPFGRYRLEVVDPTGLGITSLRFFSGWAAAADNADVPDRVEVSTDRQDYAPGATARLHVQPPFAGRASVAVLTDRLVSLREIDVPANGADVEVPVDAAWGPGAYVAVTVFRPGEARDGQPARALGLAWLGLDPAARRLDVAVEGPERVVPRGRVEIPVRVGGTAGTAFLTLAAVDEGILRLTKFATPDPSGHYLGRRALALDIRDDYGRIIPPADGTATQLRQGGDDMGDLAALDIPQRTVALFSGPVQVGPDGRATVPLDIPDFAGELRLMAVAWDGNRVGAASRPLTVRDPVVAQPLLPRFLAPGDELRLSVLLHNVDLPAGEVAATVSVEGGLQLTGPARLATTLATGAQAVPNTTLRAASSGEGVVRLAVTGPNGFRAEHEARITIRSARPAVTELSAAELPPNKDVPLAPQSDRFLSNTWRASVTFGGAVRYDPAALLRAMEDYPYFCVEQAGSRVLALAALPEEGIGGPDRLARLNRAVNFVLDRQRFDGSFGLWSAQGEEEPWLTPFAAEALLRAQRAGAAVPQPALDQALQQIGESVENSATDSPEERADQAYRVYVLSLADRPRLGAARRLLEQLDDLPTPLARAQLGAAFARGGDAARATRAFEAALAMPARRWWAHDYGTATRDTLAVTLLLQESGVLPQRRAAQLAKLPGRDMTPDNTSTQEQGWAVATAAALGRDGLPARVSLDGRTLREQPLISVALGGPATARNLGEQPLWQSVSVTGIPSKPLPAGRSGMRVTRRLLDLSGQPLKLDELHQNTSFILVIEGAAETGETHHALVQQGLPAGWEIDSRLGPGDVPGMAWLGTLSTPVATPALDDRYAAAVDLSPDQTSFRLAVRLRAVTPGRYELPGADLSDMYRPLIFARQNTGSITVLPP